MDWKTIISDLVEVGMTQEQIADKCGCAQSTISDLATGATATPRYHIGDALRTLHMRAYRRRARRREAA